MSDNIDKRNLDYGRIYQNWHSEENLDSEIEFYDHYLARHNMTFMPKTSKILDIGCATGHLLLSLQRLGYENVQGVDIDKKQVSLCKHRGLNVDCSLAADFLQDSQTVFDSIFLLDVLEHMPKQEQLKSLTLAWQAMSSNGVLMLSVPNAMSPVSHYFQNIDWTHYCSFSPSSLGFLLENAGITEYTFRPSHQEPYEVRLKKKPWCDLLKLEFGIEEPILTPSMVAVCFKDPTLYRDYLDNAPDLMNFARPKRFALKSVKRFVDRFKAPNV